MLRPIIEGAVPNGQGTAFNDQSGVMGTNSSNGIDATSQTFAHFPPKEFIRIAKAGMDLEKVMTKIIEYNVIHEDKFKLSDDQLTSLRYTLKSLVIYAHLGHISTCVIGSGGKYYF